MDKKKYNKNDLKLYFPRPLLMKQDFRDESEYYNADNPNLPVSLKSYANETAVQIGEVQESQYFGRPLLHWMIAFGTMATFILWTVFLAMDFSRMFGPMNHYEVLQSFANSTLHPRNVLDEGIVLQLPHKLVWYIMWCIGYALSAIATIIIFFHVTGSQPAYKNIFYDVGVFFPIFNLFAALAEMSIAMTSSTDITEQQRHGYWRLAEASTGILFFGAAYVFVFCRQRRSSINIIVWQSSVGFVNVLMVNAYVAFALVISCTKSIQADIHATAGSWISFIMLGVFLFLFLLDLTATFWYRTLGVYTTLKREEGFNPKHYTGLNDKPVEFLLKWTPSIYNTLIPTIYFAGLLAAWKDPDYGWIDTGAKFRHPVIAASIIGVVMFSMLTLFIAGRAFAKFQHERNEPSDDAAVTLDFNQTTYEVGTDIRATLRI